MTYTKMASLASQNGMALLESLIALVILAIGMLGIAGMLMIAHKANSSNYIKQQSVQSIYDILDRMRTNSQAAANGSYNVSNIVSSGAPTLPAPPAVDCSTASCTSTQLAAYDTWYWLSKNLALLPNGSGSISTISAGTVGNNVVTITIQWDDSPATQAKLGAIGTTTSGNANFVQLTIQSQL